MKKATTVEEYILQIPPDKKAQFLLLYDTIIQAAPGGISCISYGMPAIKLHGMLFTMQIGRNTWPSIPFLRH